MSLHLSVFPFDASLVSNDEFQTLQKEIVNKTNEKILPEPVQLLQMQEKESNLIEGHLGPSISTTHSKMSRVQQFDLVSKTTSQLLSQLPSPRILQPLIGQIISNSCVIKIECGSNKAFLDLSKLSSGSRGHCIWYDNYITFVV